MSPPVSLPSALFFAWAVRLPLLVVSSLDGADLRIGGAFSKTYAEAELLGSSASRLEALAATLRQDVERAHVEEAQPRSNQEVADSVAQGGGHGQTLFLIVCAGATHFSMFCGPLFASFERAYRGGAARHRLVALTMGVQPSILRLAEARFAPWLRFEAFDAADETLKAAAEVQRDSWKGAQVWCGAGEDEKCRPKALEGEAQKGLKIAMNAIKFMWASGYLRDHAQGFQYSVLVDSDILFFRPLDHYLPDGGVDWDVAFCTLDTDLRTPWTEVAEEIGATERGYRRLHTDILLLSLRDVDLAGRYLHRLALVADTFLTAGAHRPHSEQQRWRRWQEELVHEFGGIAEAALALLLSSYNTASLATLLAWRDCRVCSTTLEAHLALDGEESPMSVRFRALPARALNHAESMLDGAFPEDLLIVHLKGTWWRVLLGSNLLAFDTTRRPDWNRDALMLYSVCFSEWQFVLPPENRSGPAVVLYDVECKIPSWP